jgi:hypothetical protein
VPAVEAFVMASGRPDVDYLELASALVIATLWKGDSWVQELSLLIRATGDTYDDAYQGMPTNGQALMEVRWWWVRVNVLSASLTTAVSQLPPSFRKSVDGLRNDVMTAQDKRERELGRVVFPIDPSVVMKYPKAIKIWKTT